MRPLSIPPSILNLTGRLWISFSRTDSSRIKPATRIHPPASTISEPRSFPLSLHLNANVGPDVSSLGRASVDAAEEKFVTEEKERTNEIRVDVDDDVFTRGETKGGGSFDSRSVLQKCALWNDGKNQTSLSLSLFLVPSQIYFSSLFQRRSFCHSYFCSRHFSPFRIGSSGSGFPGKKWKEARRVVFFLSTVRINCNTLRIELIDRERNEISRTKKRKRKKGRERERDCKRYRVVFIA